MLTHYQEYQLQLDPDFPPPFLMNILLGKLHGALVALRSQTIGVSFPGYGLQPKRLGSKLRLHGPESDLIRLGEQPWLGGMAGHLIVGPINPTPHLCEHIAVRREQVKSNVDRLRRRRMKRHGETYEQAVLAIPDSAGQDSPRPFARLRSHSTGQMFKLFINQSQPLSQPMPGCFNAYGLSGQATVPWF